MSNIHAAAVIRKACDNHVRWLLPALFLAALVLRVWALDWSLPYVEHPDEPVLVDTVLRAMRNGDPNPHFFLYPSLPFYLRAAVMQVYLWLGVDQHISGSPQALPVTTHFFTTIPNLFIWFRALTAILGALTVPALYVLGRKLSDWRAGLLAALGLMVAPFHVEHSHYVTNDVPTGLWVVLTLIGASGIRTDQHWRHYIFAGAMAGLAASTKYQAGMVALALIVAHALAWRERSVRALPRLVAGAATALVAFLATTPYALLDWPHFIADLRFNAVHYASGSHGDFTGKWQLGEYAAFFWTKALMPSGAIITAFGLPLLLVRLPGRSVLLLLGAVIPTLLVLLLQSVHFTRNLMPIIPLLILIAAMSAVAIADFLKKASVRRLTLCAVTLALIVPQALETRWLLRYWSRPFTMADAAEFLQTLPRGMLSAVEMNPVQWAGDPAVLPVERITEHSIDWFRSRGFRYLVLNSDHRQGDDPAIYQQLLDQAEVLRIYPERRLGVQPGPGGAILDLGEHPERIPFVRQRVRFGEIIELLGYEMQAGEPRSRITPLEGANVHELAAGQSLQINMYWRALAPVAVDYTLFIHVINQTGERVAQRDLPLRYGDYPTSRWRQGELVIDRADLVLPPLPPGQYQLKIGLYDAASGNSLMPQTSHGDSISGPMLTILTIR